VAWKVENGKINPGVDSAKSIFFGVDGAGSRGGPKVYQITIKWQLAIGRSAVADSGR
jgi:hypothetical protein